MIRTDLTDAEWARLKKLAARERLNATQLTGRILRAHLIADLDQLERPRRKGGAAK